MIKLIQSWNFPLKQGGKDPTSNTRNITAAVFPSFFSARCNLPAWCWADGYNQGDWNFLVLKPSLSNFGEKKCFANNDSMLTRKTNRQFIIPSLRMSVTLDCQPLYFNSLSVLSILISLTCLSSLWSLLDFSISWKKMVED